MSCWLQQCSNSVLKSVHDINTVTSLPRLQCLTYSMCQMQIVEIGDTHGIRFPREFGMLLKQLLYFDRYTQLLAPSLSVLNDDRVNISQSTPIDTTVINDDSIIVNQPAIVDTSVNSQNLK